jgi:glutathione S-transferase
MALTLIIGSKAYSSWSLRPWLALDQIGVPFEEKLIILDEPDTAARIKQHSPSGRVPSLVDGALTVWDSLAIIEYLAEKFPQAGLWPSDATARATARAVCAEMHSGFAALRTNMPFDIRSDRSGQGRAPGVAEDIARVCELWRDCRARFGQGGPFLFGQRSAADAFYAPVVSRFTTYGVEVDPIARAYMDAVWSLPAMQRWKAEAAPEPVIGRYRK